MRVTECRGETAAWGIILADLGGHVADALGADGMGRAEPLDALIESFNDEVAAPSSRRMDGSGAAAG